MPDFIVIGAAKSGTTTLYEYLCRHPRVFMSNPKEPEFFALPECYERGLNWYGLLFGDAGKNQICGEASTAYTRFPHFPHAAERMSLAVPGAKLIYIMRDPVLRAYSDFVQEIKNQQNFGRTSPVSEIFETAIESDPRYLDASNYMMQIEQYLQYFDRRDMLFLLLEDLATDPAATLKQVCEFLEIRWESFLVDDCAIAANSAAEHEAWYVRARIMAPLHRIPGLRSLGRRLPAEWRNGFYRMLHGLFGQRVRRRFTPARMKSDTRARLITHFEPSIRELERFLGRDLSEWRDPKSKYDVALNLQKRSNET
jgi:hypothetical protein